MTLASRSIAFQPIGPGREEHLCGPMSHMKHTGTHTHTHEAHPAVLTKRVESDIVPDSRKQGRSAARRDQAQRTAPDPDLIANAINAMALTAYTSFTGKRYVNSYVQQYGDAVGLPVLAQRGWSDRTV